MIREMILAAGYAAIGYGIAAMPAAGAERIDLSRNGEWLVQYVNAEEPYCAMQSTNRYGEGLTLTADNRDLYHLFVYVDVGSDYDGAMLELGFEHGEWGTFDLTIGRTDWEGEPTVAIHMGDGMMFLTMPDVAYEFRRAIARGIYIDNGFDSGWSLRGSAAALRDLDQCRQRLGSY